MINLSGQKMSKSEGNIKLLNEYIDKFGGNIIRFFFLRSHYRKPQEFSEGLLESQKQLLKEYRISQVVLRLMFQIYQLLKHSKIL